MFLSYFWFSSRFCKYGWNRSSTVIFLSALMISLAMVILELWRKLFRLNEARFRIDSKSLLLSFLYEPLKNWLILISFFKSYG